MRGLPYVLRMILAVLALGTAGRAFAQTYVAEVYSFDSLVRNYDAVVFNNASLTSYGDTWAGLAVGGNLSLSGGAIAIHSDLYTASSDPTLYVNGQLTLNGDTQLNSGYASTPNLTGTWTFSNDNQRRLTGSNGSLTSANSSAAQANTSPLANPTPANWNWSSLQSQATSISNSLSLLSASGNVAVNTGNQTLVFSSTDTTTAGTVVFNLNAALLGSGTYNGQNFSSVQFNLGANQNAVVNVLNASGTTLFGNGVNFNDPGMADRLLWNITGSGSVSLGNGGQFYGSVLAPLMSVSNANTAVNGQIVASSLTYSNAELHYTGFSPTAVLVPEPGTFAIWAVIACAGAFGWQRWRGRRTTGL